ncbi:MAG: hypothetical protein HYX26_03205 [Acidobacteriales bacterium]|nr:hypothetical protein [Terriglobales bacterium]
MGLIQREIEARGVPTVSVTVAKDSTAAIKAPRAVFVPWPMGHHFGAPFHFEVQRRVLFAMLELLQNATQSGEIRDLPIKWADVRREARILTEQGRRL